MVHLQKNKDVEQKVVLKDLFLMRLFYLLVATVHNPGGKSVEYDLGQKLLSAEAAFNL